MLHKTRNFGLIFKNKVGIVSQVSKKVFECGGNIVASDMKKLGSHFAFDLTATFPEVQPTSQIFSDLRTGPEVKTADDYYVQVMKVTAGDNPGIIHSTSAKLEALGADITRLASRITPAPFSSGPLFSLIIEFRVDRKYSHEAIEKHMGPIIEEYGCDVQLK